MIATAAAADVAVAPNAPRPAPTPVAPLPVSSRGWVTSLPGAPLHRCRSRGAPPGCRRIRRRSQPTPTRAPASVPGGSTGHDGPHLRQPPDAATAQQLGVAHGHWRH
ncbi:hypothetical protein ZWY2020_055873 [Hordeum vulgare]|nr:hypothetical protein ZWY2020_055873 [Hordeum vulgare]